CHALHDLNVGDIELISAGCAFIRAYLSFDDYARFLRKALDRVEDFRRNCVFRHDTLDNARAVAELRKEQLPALAQVIEPATDRDRVAFVLSDFCNCAYWC